MPPGTRKYEDMILKELRAELKKHGGKLSGRKRELIDRLQFYEKNADQVGSTSNEHEIVLDTPAISTYKDIHGGMQCDFPLVTQSRLDDYLSLFDKKFDKKSEEFYNQRFLRTLRVSKNRDQLVFIKASVRAEIKMNTSYEVDISLDKDGVVQEAQCECGAGMAPTAHCKHVAAVIYGLTQFVKDGSTKTEITCTQELMTFHHAKPHKGSPMKTQDLGSVRGKSTSQYSYDPRPLHMRNREGHQDSLRNACINFQDEGRMSALQIIPPANPYALGLDHDYFELSYEDFFLEKKMISCITNDEARKIEIDTRGQAKNKYWMEMRTMRLTSSHFGTICKATERRDKLSLCLSILSPKEVTADSINHGRKYEDVAVERYKALRGVSCETCGLFVDTDKPFLAASPDRLEGESIVVEVKCPFTARDKAITTATVPYLESDGDVLKLKSDHNYFYQIQGQLLCTKRSMAHLVVFTYKDLMVIEVPYDEAFVSDMLVKLTSFYDSHFKNVLLNKCLYRNYYNYSFAGEYST